MPTVMVVSLLAHVGIFTVFTLLPPLTHGIQPAPVEISFEVAPVPEPVIEEPAPEPVIEEPVEPEVAAIVPEPRRQVQPRPEPAPPAPVLAAPEGAGPADFAMPEGEEGGVPGGVPGGTGTGTEGAVSEAAPQAAPVPARTGPSRAELRRRVMSYIRGLSGSLAGQVGYPLAARRDHLEGVVVLRIRLALDGTVLAVRMSRTSGHSVLDEAALASVQGISSLSAPPDGVPWDEARELPVPIRFRIQ